MTPTALFRLSWERGSARFLQRGRGGPMLRLWPVRNADGELPGEGYYRSTGALCGGWFGTSCFH